MRFRVTGKRVTTDFKRPDEYLLTCVCIGPVHEIILIFGKTSEKIAELQTERNPKRRRDATFICILNRWLITTDGFVSVEEIRGEGQSVGEGCTTGLRQYSEHVAATR